MRISREENFSLSYFHIRDIAGYGTFTFLIITMLFAAALSIGMLSHESIRLDEAQSLWQSSQSPSLIMKTVASDVHVPLYHLILHFWRLAFGDGIETARMLSLLFFLLTIPAAYFLGKIAYGDAMGMALALMVAVSPFLNWYGSEARMYSMLALVTVLNQYCFIKLFKHPSSGTWFVYGITAVLGIFTHYFFALVLITQACFFFTHKSSFERYAVLKFIIAGGVVILSFAPWGYYVWNLGSAGNTRPQLPIPTTVNLFNTFSEFLFGFQPDAVNTVILSAWPLAVLFGFLAIRRSRPVKPETLYLILASITPIVAAFVLSILLQPFYMARYLILALPSLYLVIAWFFFSYPRKLGLSAQTAAVVLMLGMLTLQTVNADTPVKENYRDATEYLNAHAGPRDIVIISAPFTIYPVEYYYSAKARVTTFPVWSRYDIGGIPAFSPERLSEDVRTLTREHDRAYVLLSYDQGYEETLRLYFDTHFERITAIEFSRNLTLYGYRLRYDRAETARAF